MTNGGAGTGRGHQMSSDGGHPPDENPGRDDSRWQRAIATCQDITNSCPPSEDTIGRTGQ